MMNNGNEMVDSDTNCIVNCNTPNSNNESSPTSKNPKYFHKILKYFSCFAKQLTRSNRKKFNTRHQNVNIRKCKKKICTASLSSTADYVIKPDAEGVAKIEVETKQVKQNLSDVRHFAPGTSYRYAEYVATRNVDNAMPTHGCCPLCVETQCATVDGEFSLTTRPDAFAKACEHSQHANVALEKIANVPDSLTKKVHFVSKKEQPSLTSTLMSSTFEPGEEIFETKSLILPVICAEEETVGAAKMITMGPEAIRNEQELTPFSNDFSPDSLNCSTDFDESLDIHLIPVQHLKEMERTCTTSIMYPKEIDFQDTAVNTIGKETNKKEKESTLNKHVFVTDRTNNAAIAFTVASCLSKPKKNIYNSPDLYKRKNSTNVSKKEAIKNGAIKSSIETSHTEKKFKGITKNVRQESGSRKKSKYQAKYCIADSYPRYLQPAKQCKDLIPENYLEKPECCNVSNFPCFSWQNKATQNINLTHFPQDLCKHKSACCHSSVDATIGCSDIDYCAKRSLTLENALPATAFCKNGAKCCYSYLNNTDNFRRECYHWSDSCPAGNDNRHCGRDRSHYWTKENLYFKYPWTPMHLLPI